MTTGKMTTMGNTVEGPTSIFVTTTDPHTDPETKSRFYVTAVDESREQTRAIQAFQRKRQTLEGFADRAAGDALLKKHRNFQRLLRPLAVVNPFAERLGYGDDRLQGRRDQPKYLNLIKAVAFLRQMQKAVKSFGNPDLPQAGVGMTTFEYIEVDRTDIEIANRLTVALFGQRLDELSRPGRTLLEELEKMAAGDEAKRAFTRRQIRERTGWSNYRVHTHLNELIEFEYVAAESGRNGELYRYRLIYDGEGKDGEKFVLGLKTPE
jgi:hypothetical protein